MDQQTVTFKDKEYKLDKYGFLESADQWDEDFAEGMARSQGIVEGLTEDHWKFIRYLRDKVQNEKAIPVVVLACAENSLRLNDLRTLFPTGYHRGACRIAGINFAWMADDNLWHSYECVPPREAEHEIDKLGYLKDFGTWNERFALWVVSKWNLPTGLTDKHWEIIHYLRDFFRDNNNIPTVFELCRAHDIDLGELGTLFPEGYRRGACRAAGLPFFG